MRKMIFLMISMICAETSTRPSSIYNINNITTTTGKLSEAWKQIRIPQCVKYLGFGITHLEQIQKLGHVSAEEVQRSLNHFAYDLKENVLSPLKTTPLGFLVGILRKQAYTSSAFLTQEIKEIDEYLKRSQKLKQMQKEIEEAKKQKTFEVWFKTLTEQDKKSLVEYNRFLRPNTDMEKVVLKATWEKKNMAKKEKTGNYEPLIST